MISTYLPGGATPTLRHLAAITAQLDALDVAGSILGNGPRETLTRALQLEQAARRPATLADRAAATAARLAAGEIDLDTAVAEAAQHATGATVEHVKATLDTAARQARAAAVAAYRRAADNLIGALDKAVRQAADDAAKQLAAVPGVNSDAAALSAGGNTMTAWARAVQLTERIEALQGIADDIRAHGVARIQRVDVDGVWIEPQPPELHYAAPWVLTRDAEQADHPVTRLRAALPAQPCERTFTQWRAAVDELRDGYAAQRDAEQAERDQAAAAARRAANAHRADVERRMADTAA